MKKFISMICTLVVLFVSVVPVSASNGDDYTVTSTELVAKRIVAELTGKDEKEIAKDILRDLGMSERIVNLVTDEFLEKVYLAQKISLEKEYGKFTEDEIVSFASEEEYLMDVDASAGDGIMTRSLTGETEDSYSDEYFLKSIYAIETSGAETGTIFVMCGFEWLEEPLFRCKDVIAISGTNVVFDEKETSLSVGYTQTVTNVGSGSITAEDYIDYYDFDDLNLESNILFSGSYVAAACNLPNDVPGVTLSVNNTNLALLLMTSCMVSEIAANQTLNLSFTGWYFHQVIGWDTSINISMSEASLSISPSAMYRDPNQIQIIPKFSV